MFENEALNAGRAKKGHRYSASLKEFALTLHYYSPQAYDYCRTILKLPDPASLRNWLVSAKVDVGFLQTVLLSLQQKPAIEQECSLIIDSMSLRKQTIYNSASGKYDGFVDYGPGGLIGEQTDILATEALVFLLVSLHSNWKVPIAFFYVDKVQSSIQGQLVNTALQLTADHGIRVRCITFDGAAANISMANALGCSLGSSGEMVTHFNHPSLNIPVYIILDVCHMLKLARNALAELGTLTDASGKSIRWSYIQKLVELQQREGLHLANKLSNVHVQWQKLKMKVKIAAQTFSKSVADALQFLSAVDDEFKEVGATVEFIRYIDVAFDILNSRSSFGRGSKSPLRACNMDVWESQLLNVSHYLGGLETSTGQLLSTHRRRTFVIGFQCSIISIMALTKELLTRGTNSFDYVLTFKMSQDHIECLFSKIRSMGGFNNNPNVIHFKAALRKLLVKQQISASTAANCADSSVSGAIFELKWSRRTSAIDNNRFEESSQEDEELFSLLDGQVLTEVQSNILYYIAGYIIRKISADISCADCILLLRCDMPASRTLDHGYSIGCNHNMARLVTLKDRGGLLYPTEELFNIIKVAEKLFRTVATKQRLNTSVTLLRLRTAAFQALCEKGITFPSIEHEQPLAVGETSHECALTLKVLNLFFKLRMHYYGKIYTSDVIHQKQSSNRNLQNRLTIFRHW